jgi:hypothetical protein
MKAKSILMGGCTMIAIMLINYYQTQAQSLQPVKPPGITSRDVAADLTDKVPGV